MRTQVFVYNGIIGIESDLEVEGLINDPLAFGQSGFIVDAEYVDIQPEALELLKQIKVSKTYMGQIEIYKNYDSKIIFSWLGGAVKVMKLHDIIVSSLYDVNLLKPNDKVMPSKQFIDFVEKNL